MRPYVMTGATERTSCRRTPYVFPGTHGSPLAEPGSETSRRSVPEAKPRSRYTDFSVCPSLAFLVRRYDRASPVVGTSSANDAVTDKP